MPDIRVTVMPGGSITNVKGTVSKQYDIALAHTQDIATAVMGKKPFTEKVDNLRGLMNLWTNFVQIGVSPASGITLIADMKGKRIAPGFKGWGGEAAPDSSGSIWTEL